MKIWKYIALILLGICLGLCLAFKLKGPEIEIRQQIKKMKQRGTGNTQEANMQTILPKPEKRKKGLFGWLKRDPKKKAERKARRKAKKK
jgi:anthranilate/para-aminobenzoate synthase component II